MNHVFSFAASRALVLTPRCGLLMLALAGCGAAPRRPPVRTFPPPVVAVSRFPAATRMAVSARVEALRTEAREAKALEDSFTATDLEHAPGTKLVTYLTDAPREQTEQDPDAEQDQEDLDPISHVYLVAEEGTFDLTSSFEPANMPEEYPPSAGETTLGSDPHVGPAVVFSSTGQPMGVVRTSRAGFTGVLGNCPEEDFHEDVGVCGHTWRCGARVEVSAVYEENEVISEKNACTESLNSVISTLNTLESNAASEYLTAFDKPESGMLSEGFEDITMHATEACVQPDARERAAVTRAVHAATVKAMQRWKSDGALTMTAPALRTATQRYNRTSPQFGCRRKAGDGYIVRDTVSTLGDEFRPWALYRVMNRQVTPIIQTLFTSDSRVSLEFSIDTDLDGIDEVLFATQSYGDNTFEWSVASVGTPEPTTPEGLPTDAYELDSMRFFQTPDGPAVVYDANIFAIRNDSAGAVPEKFEFLRNALEPELQRRKYVDDAFTQLITVPLSVSPTGCDDAAAMSTAVSLIEVVTHAGIERPLAAVRVGSFFGLDDCKTGSAWNRITFQQ